jgi:hypothetical protein
MKERRKIFSAADLAAIKDGRKTMFREMVKLPLKDPLFGCEIAGCEINGLLKDSYKLAPLGTIGDRLWLPEAWMVGRKQNKELAFGWVAGHVWSKDRIVRCPRNWSERDLPSITMPRWACRTFAEITGVCVERVQEMEGMDAASSDALKEGVNRIHHEGGNYYYSAFRNQPDPKNWTDPYLAFKELWQSRHGNWDANPWVWVYSIKLIKL